MSETLSLLKSKRAKSPPLPFDAQHIQTITTLNDKVISEAVREKDTQTSFSLLGQLQHEIKNGKYGTYSISKKHYHYHMFVYHHNLALTNQEAGENSQAKVQLELAIGHYEKIQGFITNREQNLVFQGEMAKIQLQYCGLLSHCDMHKEAAALAEKSLDRVIESAKILQAVCYEQTLFNAQRETTCSSREKGSRSQFVDFKVIVIQEAETVLQELARLPPIHKVLTDLREHYLGIISKVFAWKENETNNETALRKELKIAQEKGTKTGRSILGLQKQTSQGQFQIGTFMTLCFRNIVYHPHADPLRLLSPQYLRGLAFYAALGYFMAATETRFSQPELGQMRGSMKIDQKYQKLNHDECLLNCKILHLKALEVSGKLLPSGNALFPHLATSFSRNYKFVMDEIKEVSEANSTHLIERHPPKEEATVQGEYGIRITPTRLSKRAEQSKMDKSKARKSQNRRSKSQNKLRSMSGRKKAL